MRTALPSPGDVVWIRQSRWRVERVRRERGVLRLDVAGTLGARTFLAPFDRPIALARPDRPRNVRPQHARARLASIVSRTVGIHTLPAAGAAAVAILSYQLEPALAFATGARRVLIADDVGLGKTIQAGAVIAELLRREPVARVLILVPSALRRQWLDELSARFSIACTVADTAALDRLSRSGARSDSPWQRAGVWITSSDFVKQPHVIDALPIEPWDLIVIDEAHGACGESSRHRATDRLARRSRRVLLLTATPHAGDEERFQRLIGTGALTGVADPLVVFRRTRRSLGLRVDRRVRWHPVQLSDAELRVLDVLIAFERTVLRAAGADRRDHALLLLSVFRKRALSSMAALAASLARRRQWVEDGARHSAGTWEFQPSLFGEDDRDDVLDRDEQASIATEIGLSREDERSWLSRLQLLTDAAHKNDRRLARLVELVRRTREPVAVFTEFRDSLNAAASALSAIREVATLHGGQSFGEQHRELDRFLSGGASVLLATDVASQGLNLQSRARWVIGLELPWNPARIEQRAGRVDRIGQTRPVHVTLLVARHHAESGLLARLARRACAAQRSLGADVLRDVTPDAARVRAALLEGAPLDLDGKAQTSGALVPVCKRLERPGRAAARRVLRQRAIAAFGREPAPDSAGPVQAKRTRLPAIARLTMRGIAVFVVPISDRAGSVVEQHAVAVRTEEHDAVLTAAEIDCCRRAAECHLAPRLRRLKRIAGARQAIDVAREHALADALALEANPSTECEPGLFDQRVVRDLDRQRADVEAIRTETNRRLRALDAGASLEIGRAVLEVVLR